MTFGNVLVIEGENLIKSLITSLYNESSYELMDSPYICTATVSDFIVNPICAKSVPICKLSSIVYQLYVLKISSTAVENVSLFNVDYFQTELEFHNIYWFAAAKQWFSIHMNTMILGLSIQFTTLPIPIIPHLWMCWIIGTEEDILRNVMFVYFIMNRCGSSDMKFNIDLALSSEAKRKVNYTPFFSPLGRRLSRH